MTIFISIAAYRDPELVPTVLDCLAKARHPEALRFGICWQRGPEEAPLPFAEDPRFRILDVDWRESRGACWARAEVMGLYEGEDHFLQLDSHHRFVPDWDVRVLEQLARTGSDKPVLTAYATPYTPGEPETFGTEPMQMNFDRFTAEGIVLFRPSAIPNHRELERPVRARFLSGHFLFAPGSFVREVPYDPDLYFIGEEITLTIRAFTHGWDFFHPTEIIVFHEYTRAYRDHKHWSDHNDTNAVETAWHVRDAASKARVKDFIDARTIGPFACGEVRTFEAYEAYAGLSFAQRKAQEYTLRHHEPPNPPVEAGWADRVARYDLSIALDRATLPEGAETARFWFVGFHDEHGEELYRRDADAAEVARLITGGEGPIVIKRTFETERIPRSWTVWPFSKDGEWLDKVRGEIVVAGHRPATYVTALLDLGRDTLDEAHSRSFLTHYLPRFERLLAIDAPMVVYVSREHEPLVWKRRRRDNTRVVPLERHDIEALPFYEGVTAVRTRPEWQAQAPWLRESPQARLSHYAPLVLAKMRFLRDVARDDPFSTAGFFWIDAALSHTVAEHHLLDPALSLRLTSAARDLLFIAYPHHADKEIHGFDLDAMTRLANTTSITRVVRGGLFGGRRDAVLGVAALYGALLRETLEAGLLGTEESLLTILDHRHPELMQPFVVEEDGLLGPFFDALAQGAEGVLKKPLPVRSAFVRPVTVDDRAVARLGESRFFGLRMQQNLRAPYALDGLFRQLESEGVHVRRIIELGTGSGGLSVLLALYCLDVGAEFVTYDAHARALDNPAFVRLGIDLRVKDVRHAFVSAEIARAISSDGVTILVCDGGDKLADVNLFADHMKTGDLVLVHDYAASKEVFERDVRGRLWSWCEATDAGLRAPTERNDLRELMPELMHDAVWTCRRKHGGATKPVPAKNITGTSCALYAVSYNLPAQFRLFLESVREGDPAMFARTEKFLLNNSTDASTFAAYDALCAEYGFTQIKRGNLGITGGRIFCAHHFETSDHDVMLYFEDDMLISSREGSCRNGFPTHVPRLFERSLAILENERGLDFLKLSFTEFFGDHRTNWAYTNLDDAGKRLYFPDGDETRIDAIKSHDGLAYARAEVHYANWPMLITRRGSATLFARDVELPRHEQGFMVRALELGRRGELETGVLLASPIEHRRDHHYGAGERKES